MSETPKLREGQRVFCIEQEEEGIVLRDEDWGDFSVPVLLHDSDYVAMIAISKVMAI